MALSPPHRRFSAAPEATGLYDPRFERDACGLAMVATLRGTAGHDIIETALGALRNLEHRGAVGSDAGTGDGAGIMTQIPDAFLRGVVDFELPANGRYAVGPPSCPSTRTRGPRSSTAWPALTQEQLRVLGWREVPVDPTRSARSRARRCPPSGSCSASAREDGKASSRPQSWSGRSTASASAPSTS